MIARSSASARSETLFTGALAIAFLLKVGLALWASNRGLELGDEGYFLLNLNHPESAPPPFEFYRLLAGFDSLRIGVVEARLLRIVVELVGSLSLIAAIFVWARAQGFGADAMRPARFALFCLLGSFLSVASRSLGYNDVTNLCVYLAATCFFFMLASPQAGRRALFAIGAGAATGFQLSVKFPSAILLFGTIALGSLVFLREVPARTRACLVFLYASAAAGAVVAVILATGGLEPLLERLRIARQLPALTGYDPVALLHRYVALEIWTYVNAAVFATVFSVVLWWRRRRDVSDLDRVLATALLASSIALFVSVVPLHPTFLHWTLVYLACLLVVLPVALGATTPHRAALAPLVVLFALPMIEIMGTNVPLTMRLPSHLLPLFVLLAVLVYEARERTRGVRFEHLLIAILVLITSVEVVHHQWNEPYGLPRPLPEQTVPVAGRPGMRVDAATAAFLETVAKSMAEAGFRPGDPIVAFDYMPGLVSHLGGVSFGSNLYMFDRPLLNCFEINRATNPARPYLILGQPMHVEQQACLRAFAFPGDFELIRTVSNPYEDVYTGFGRPDLSHVQLWRPKPAAGDQRR